MIEANLIGGLRLAMQLTDACENATVAPEPRHIDCRWLLICGCPLFGTNALHHIFFVLMMMMNIATTQPCSLTVLRRDTQCKAIAPRQLHNGCKTSANDYRGEPFFPFSLPQMSETNRAHIVWCMCRIACWQLWRNQTRNPRFIDSPFLKHMLRRPPKPRFSGAAL